MTVPAGRVASEEHAPDRPLRIAMISYYLPSGSKQGIGYQVHELATELVRRGHHVDVISECPPVPGAVYGHRHVELSGSLRTFRFATAVRRLDLSGYDVVHAHGDDYWMWRRRTGRHVRTLHGSCFEEARRIRGAKERTRMVLLGLSEVLASVVADRTVVVSPGTRRWYPWVRDVVPNGVDLRRFRPQPEVRAAHPVVLFVGAWHGRKNGDELARQFVAHVRSRHPDAELWMVSRDVPEDAGPGVRSLGALDDAALADAYRRAWVFCLPSDYEGFGIPYVEAMASGLPVVATANVGARYVSAEGRAALLTPLDGVGVALADLLADDVRREALAEAGAARAQEYSLRRVVDRYEELYRGAV
ncbi:glycosyltransferase involved in cell wall biosynthesis [Isoptericola sp. CG 20/1183]|uniref:D-inositol 3-phosphate glycosyltransferase n=1 Tax=Isoptericola halotolerans TaxID=300560 RepID=A0ABX5EDW4_9MICO|nr:MULTISPECIES: glycosyltransferase family 4 protein [Isoptericola]PRZ06425.1 glycosyltransferase involved in cell wall biosynthesis [Isoptericola halotolerans]PRZ06769.1 glycosyltransferase involved in cell wall biosynthesis [Isoptericola sp. CG 20/1183]